MENRDGIQRSTQQTHLVESSFPKFSYYDIQAIDALSAYVWEWSKPDDGMVWYLTAIYCAPEAALFLGFELKVNNVQRLYYVKEYDVRFVPGFDHPISFRYPSVFKVTVLNLHSSVYSYAWAMSFFEVAESG